MESIEVLSQNHAADVFHQNDGSLMLSIDYELDTWNELEKDDFYEALEKLVGDELIIRDIDYIEELRPTVSGDIEIYSLRILLIVKGAKKDLTPFISRLKATKLGISQKQMDALAKSGKTKKNKSSFFGGKSGRRTGSFF